MRLSVCFTFNLLSFVYGQFNPTSHPNWRFVNDESCGLQSKMRIFGGRDAGLGEFPWMVLLHVTTYYETGERKEICGGSIISQKYVLSAAHCVVKPTKFSVILRAGEYNVKGDPDCERGICAPKYLEYYTRDIKIHPDYRPNIDGSGQDPQGDLALLKNEQGFIFSDFVRPICLEYGELLHKDYSKQMAQIVGFGAWGYSNDRLSLADRLQKAPVRILNDKDCQMYLTAFEATRHQDAKLQFCAGNQTTFSYIGDSGSAMFISKAVGGDFPRAYLIGVTSVSFNLLTDPGGRRRPSIYVRVSKYLKWILDEIRD